MGGGNSKSKSWRQASRSSSSSSSWNQYNFDIPSSQYTPQNQNYETEPPPPYVFQSQHYEPDRPPPPQNQNYVTQSSPPYVGKPQHTGPSRNFDAQIQQRQKRLERKYSRIADDYSSLEQVTEALATAGLESSNLIVGIDFTKSNEWTGAKSYNRRSLHHVGNNLNPYEQAISIIGKTLAAFDEDNMIPCFGFGDASTHDQDIFSFFEDDRFCNGFEEVMNRYREIVPHLRLAGPTSFAPVIEMAMSIVEQSNGQYHVLLIIADGQVTRSVDTENGRLSPQEQKTIEAIVKASHLPLSIILVGVGDGPWDMMREFDDNIPARAFDNFQFVNFTEIMSKNTNQTRKEMEFALSALMEIPSQYKATIELELLGRRGNSNERVALPPPMYGGGPKPTRSTSFQKPAPSYYGDTGSKPSRGANFSPPYDHGGSNSDAGTAPPENSFDNQLCAICLSNTKNMAFGCGHQTCCDCGESLQLCPICRSHIQTRIKLY